jgi:hypothetical protein
VHGEYDADGDSRDGDQGRGAKAELVDLAKDLAKLEGGRNASRIARNPNSDSSPAPPATAAIVLPVASSTPDEAAWGMPSQQASGFSLVRARVRTSAQALGAAACHLETEA